MESLQREHPEAAVYLPQTFNALREAALKFEGAFRALATTQARDIVARYGQKL
jgi:autonomous glycyl radical cofactor GrcA